jgi:hypothetical protein
MPAPKGNRNARGNKGGGRPSEYKPEYAQIAAKACELGATNFELGQMFGVSSSTIIGWTHRFVEFSEAVLGGKEKADERVERALFNRAVGYSFESEKVFQFQGVIVRADTVEHVPPDPAAAFNWLKNRRPEQWRDKSEQVIRHEIANELSDNELSRIAASSGNGAIAPKVDTSKLN